MLPLLIEAAKFAVPRHDGDKRTSWHAAIGVRGDGALVVSQNGSVITSVTNEPGWSFPSAHAEARVSRKMNYGGMVYVARVARDGSLAMSKPCFSCMMAMKARNVRRVFYSISDEEYGCLDLR